MTDFQRSNQGRSTFDSEIIEELSTEELKEKCRQNYINSMYGEEEFRAYLDAIFEYLQEIDEPTDEIKSEIGDLLHKHPDNEEINELVSTVLGKCSDYAKDKTELQRIVKEISELYARFPDNLCIAYDYVSAITDLMNAQDYDEALVSFDQLRAVKENFSDNEDLEYYLQNAKEVLEHKVNLEKYDEQALMAKEQYLSLHNEQSAIKYAEYLGKLSGEISSESECKKIADFLLKLSEEYPSCGRIMVSYAESLYSLSKNQDFDTAKKTIPKIWKLMKNKDINEEIASIYAKAVAEQMIRNSHDIRNYLSALVSLYELYPFNESIMTSYALGLYCMEGAYIIKDEREERLSILKRLRLLSEASNNKEVKEYYEDAMNSFNSDEEYSLWYKNTFEG